MVGHKMRLLPWPALKEAKGWPYTRRHTDRLVKAGKFPSPIRVGERRIAWDEAVVDAHLAAVRDGVRLHEIAASVRLIPETDIDGHLQHPRQKPNKSKPSASRRVRV
jgi:prophage regulatory protein